MLGPRREGGGIDSWGKRAPATISCKLVGDSEVAAAAAGSWRCGARSRSVDEPCAARLSVECAVAIAAVGDDPAVIPTARALSVVSTVPTTAALVASVAEVVVPWMIRLAMGTANALSAPILSGMGRMRARRRAATSALLEDEKAPLQRAMELQCAVDFLTKSSRTF